MPATTAPRSAIDRIAIYREVIGIALPTVEAMVHQLSKQNNEDCIRAASLAGPLCLHCSAIQLIAKADQAAAALSTKNLFALSALSRAALDAYVALFYFGIEIIPQAEFRARDLIWKADIAHKQVGFLSLISGLNAEDQRRFAEHQAASKSADEAMAADAVVSAVDKETKGKLLKHRTVYMEHERKIIERSQFSASLYDLHTRTASQFVHATPWAAEFWIANDPTGEAAQSSHSSALGVTAMSLVVTMAYLCESFPALQSLFDPRVLEVMNRGLQLQPDATPATAQEEE